MKKKGTENVGGTGPPEKKKQKEEGTDQKSDSAIKIFLYVFKTSNLHSLSFHMLENSEFHLQSF